MCCCWTKYMVGRYSKLNEPVWVSLTRIRKGNKRVNKIKIKMYAGQIWEGRDARRGPRQIDLRETQRDKVIFLKM